MKKLVLPGIVLVVSLTHAVASNADMEKNGDVLVRVLSVAPVAHSLYRNDQDGILQYGAGALSAQALTSAGKRSFSKERPNGNCCRSMPSSHASAAFHSAFYIGERYSYGEAAPYFAGAAYVAYSRVHADKHDVEDVVAGAGLSFLVNHYFTGDETQDGRPRIGVYTRDDGGVSFVLDWRW